MNFIARKAKRYCELGYKPHIVAGLYLGPIVAGAFLAILGNLTASSEMVLLGKSTFQGGAVIGLPFVFLNWKILPNKK